MIWVKTEAGRAEMQARRLVKERPSRNLLLLIDGAKSQQVLLEGLVGVGVDDFVRLEALGLIAPLVPLVPSVAEPAALHGAGAVGVPHPVTAPATEAAPAGAATVEPGGLDYAGYTAALTGLISKELGLRGFLLTLAVEKASSIEALRAVGEKVVAQIGERRGEAAAAAARRSLNGD